MSEQDIRWLQRLSNYRRALDRYFLLFTQFEQKMTELSHED